MDDSVIRDDSTAGRRSHLEVSLLMYLTADVKSLIEFQWAVGFSNLT